jgi:hypothetical protein
MLPARISRAAAAAPAPPLIALQGVPTADPGADAARAAAAAADGAGTCAQSKAPGKTALMRRACAAVKARRVNASTGCLRFSSVGSWPRARTSGMDE